MIHGFSCSLLKRLSIVVFCSILAACSAQQKSTLQTNVFSSEFLQTELPIEGKWSRYYFIGSEELFMNIDGTFRYSETTCLANKYSAGRWKFNGYYYTLVSYKTYNENRITSRIKSPRNSMSVEDQQVGIIWTSTRDSSYVHFDHHTLILRGDTLGHFTAQGALYNKYTKQQSNH